MQDEQSLMLSYFWEKTKGVGNDTPVIRNHYHEFLDEIYIWNEEEMLIVDIIESNSMYDHNIPFCPKAILWQITVLKQTPSFLKAWKMQPKMSFSDNMPNVFVTKESKITIQNNNFWWVFNNDEEPVEWM